MVTFGSLGMLQVSMDNFGDLTGTTKQLTVYITGPVPVPGRYQNGTRSAKLVPVIKVSSSPLV